MLKTLQEVVNLPTAPFAEDHVIAYIRRFVNRRPHLRLVADDFGNLLVRYWPPKKSRVRRPVLFAAHMDHPGFVASRMENPRLVRADFRGWVQSKYFAGAKIQFFTDRRWIPAVIEKVIPPKKPTHRAVSSARSFGAEGPPAGVIARAAQPIKPGCPGMWRFPDAVVRGNLIRARACDDLAGLAAVLCMLDEICRRKIACETAAFFTRAEEVGFAGALAAVDAKTVPEDSIVVAVECSKAVTGVAFGAGPVLRVGDKASVFTPAATAYCQIVAERLAAKDRSFQFQRKLMDGGTCESTAYCHYGYDATGICLPLGNYHNMDSQNRRLGPEYIDVRDFKNLVKWFVALAMSPISMKYEGAHPGLHQRLEALLKQHRSRLVRTARKVTQPAPFK